MVTFLRWRDTVKPGEVFHTARVMQPYRKAVPYHRHDFAEVFWVDAGRGMHRVNGQVYTLASGMLVFMRPEDAHSIEGRAQEELRFTNIAFENGTRNFLGERYFKRKRGTWWSKKALPEMRLLSAPQLTLVNRWADELAQSPQERFAIERFLMNLLAELDDERMGITPEGTPDWLAEACRAIRKPEHLSGGVHAFLALAGRGREHTARSMRRHLGASPTDYVNRVRMEHAAHLLEMSSRSILEIAGDCGLGNLGHFYQLFHKVHRTTPRAYRERYRRTL